METEIKCVKCNKNKTVNHTRGDHRLAPTVCDECALKIPIEEYNKLQINQKDKCKNKFCPLFGKDYPNNCEMIEIDPECDQDNCKARLFFEVKPKSNSVTIINSDRSVLIDRPKLKHAVSDLLDLILDVYKGRKDRVSFDEAFAIYKHRVGSGYRTYSYESPDGKWIAKKCQWTQYEWERNFRNWIFRALGTLIEKGCLTVIPTIEVMRVEPASIEEKK